MVYCLIPDAFDTATTLVQGVNFFGKRFSEISTDHNFSSSHTKLSHEMGLFLLNRRYYIEKLPYFTKKIVKWALTEGTSILAALNPPES